MRRYKNANEILSDLENRRSVSSSYRLDDDPLEAPQSVTNNLLEVPSRSERDSTTTHPQKSGSIPLSLAEGMPYSLTETDLRAYSRIAKVLAGIDPPKPREVPWDATDWFSPLSGYSYGNTARQVPGAAEEWASRYDRYTPSVPTYSTYSGRRMAIDWVSLLQILGCVLGIFAILGYVAIYFALQ